MTKEKEIVASATSTASTASVGSICWNCKYHQWTGGWGGCADAFPRRLIEWIEMIITHACGLFPFFFLFRVALLPLFSLYLTGGGRQGRGWESVFNPQAGIQWTHWRLSTLTAAGRLLDGLTLRIRKNSGWGRAGGRASGGGGGRIWGFRFENLK